MTTGTDACQPAVDEAARDKAVRSLYEQFPYPPPLKDVRPFLSRKKVPAFNPVDSSALYFPWRAPIEELDVLIAGCGTRTVPMFAAYMPKARIVGVDISAASLEVSKAQCEQFGLKNVEHHQLPLEEVAQLSQRFDWINCQGVLHHLKDPAAGLRALGQVLRPDGAMSIMVYGKYGRTGVYMLQELCQRVGMGSEPADAERMQSMVRDLPKGHPIGMLPYGDNPKIPLQEAADLFLHPRDVAYTVDGVRQLIDSAGMKFHRWLDQGQYAPEISPVAAHGLMAKIGSDPWARAAAMELFWGKLAKHSFVVTHPEMPSAAERFSGSAFVDAIAIRNKHAMIEVTGQGETEQVTVYNLGQQVPVKLSGPVPLMRTILNAADGSQSIGQIGVRIAGAGAGDAQLIEAISLLRNLYIADVLDVRVA